MGIKSRFLERQLRTTKPKTDRQTLESAGAETTAVQVPPGVQSSGIGNEAFDRSPYQSAIIRNGTR